MCRLITKIVLLFFCFNIAITHAMELTITIDDLPASGNLPKPISRIDVAEQMLRAFNKHNLKGVYGFINGVNVKSNEDWRILTDWVNDGQRLANHTFSHIDLSAISTNSYLNDILKNDDILAATSPSHNYRYFRYPYLAEGETLSKRNAVRHYLFKNSYQIAEVTIDFFDYLWNQAYVRCLNKRDNSAINWLKKSYIEEATNALIVAHELSLMLFKRDIKNILLLHLNAFNALMLDELLTRYEELNVKFLSLNETLTDAVYQINPNIVEERTYTFLNQIRRSKNLGNPTLVSKIYANFPEKKLNKLCLT